MILVDTSCKPGNNMSTIRINIRLITSRNIFIYFRAVNILFKEINKMQLSDICDVFSSFKDLKLERQNVFIKFFNAMLQILYKNFVLDFGGGKRSYKNRTKYVCHSI